MALVTLVNHAVSGGEVVDPVRRAVTRLIRVEGTLRRITVALDRDGVDVETEATGERELEAIAEKVRFWFDLDTDLEPVETSLGADPHLEPLVKQRPGLRVTRHPEGFEATIGAVLGQQVSLAAGRTFSARLLEACGTPGPAGLTAFPAPDRLAGESAARIQEAVGLTGARTRTVLAVAGLFASGFMIGPGVDPVDARASLLALPGVGPWTTDYLAIRAMEDSDSFPVGDAVLRRALGGGSHREMAARSSRWAPWRSYAATHLWAAAADPAWLPIAPA
ncbi:MAG: hypothetical protein M3Y45_10620 [Actinomycetota bacterium]|nr:hypothetical protein [Actinomycetota bacterium]